MTKNQTFEEALARLEEIVGTLEEGNTSLDESVALYKEGVGITKFLKVKLKNAETELNKLTRDEEGNFQLQLM